MGCRYVKEFEFGGKVSTSDLAQDRKLMAAAVHKHEKAQHQGEPLTKLAKGGKASCKCGGAAKK